MSGGKKSPLSKKLRKEFEKQARACDKLPKEIRVQKIGEEKKLRRYVDGKHHCPAKDAASTHVVKESSCIRKCHVGWCPTCFFLVSYLDGCFDHHFKKEDLLKTRPLPWRDIKRFNIMRGLLGPRGVDARTSCKVNGREFDEKTGNEHQSAERSSEAHISRTSSLETMSAKSAIREAAIELVIRDGGKTIIQDELATKNNIRNVPSQEQKCPTSTQSGIKTPRQLVPVGGWQSARRGRPRFAGSGTLVGN